MKTSTGFIIALIGSGILVMYIASVGVRISAMQGTVAAMLLGGIIVGGFLYYFIRDRKSIIGFGYDSIAFENYVIEWAKKNKNIDLQAVTDDSTTIIHYPPSKEQFAAVRLNRSHTDRYGRAGQPFIAVVHAPPMKVRAHYDNPPTHLLNDPFTLVGRGFSGAPTPDADPQRDIGTFQQQFGFRGRRGGTYISVGGEQQNDFFRKEDQED
jgi:hypothetical protein